MTQTVDLLDFASLFPFIASNDEIESERQRQEALHESKIEVHQVTHPTHSGARCTRVEWKQC